MTQSSVLFLDVDGVLNTMTHTNNLPEGSDPALHFMPHLVRLVADWLCLHPEVDVVLSSDWRRPDAPGRAFVNATLRSMGFPRDIADETPQHPWTMGSGAWSKSLDPPHRGREIAEWLEAHPEVGSFVCLDDDDDFAPVGAHLVRTSCWNGVQSRQIQRLVRVLALPRKV